ncbi:hypothetical protein, partial [Burkholderia gladioli]|uniref:hypothetical protein n=1 Tax=Burkholderia gladioli TaxID=28095 RepID=UPI0039E8759C
QQTHPATSALFVSFATKPIHNNDNSAEHHHFREQIRHANTRTSDQDDLHINFLKKNNLQ